MKIFIFFLITFSALSFAKVDFQLEDFEELTFEQKVQAVDAYREFLRDHSSKTELSKFSSHRFSFFTEAWASGNFDCFYAGWPSRSTPKRGGGRLCSSPMNGNPDYRRIASSCGASSLLCQPAIFGPGLCVSVATSALRNSAFQQCDQKFRDAGRTTADVVRELDTPEERADLQELFGISDRVCRDGFQPGICNRLSEKLSAIREAGGATLLSAVQTAVTVTDAGVRPVPVDCDPNTPGIQTTPPTQQVPAQPTSNNIVKRTCPRPPLSGEAMPEAEVLPQLAANNIRIVAGSISDTRHITRFMEDFNRFPAPLREEMRRNGSRIHLIFGQGVSEDPSWAQEAARASHPDDWKTTHDGRPWSEVPGAGGALGRRPSPTRIVVNRLYEGHGASSLFLHEYGHTLDSMYGEHAITRSRIWRRTLARDARSREFIQAICGNYCNDTAHPEEAFAELFAYYHACGETNAHMKQLMPNISRLFDRMTNVRDLLDGRINLDEPATTIAQSSQQRRRSALTVSADGNRRQMNSRSVSPRVSSDARPALRPTGVSREAPSTNVPQVARRPQSSSNEAIISPSRALDMVASGQLSYLGRGLLPGSDTVGSCVFSNEQVYVIVHGCRRNGAEAPATNIEIITRDGQKVNYYIENSENTDRTVGLPSQIRRENYDRSWRISYQQLGPPPASYSLESMRQYLQGGMSRIGDNCTTGGMMVGRTGPLTRCNGGMAQYQDSWSAEADSFHASPGDVWYGFLRTMRQKVQATAGQ